MKFLLILVVTLTVAAGQPSIKKATHMAFYKWVAPNNNIAGRGASDLQPISTSSPSSVSREDQAQENEKEKPSDVGPAKNDTQESDDARKILEFLRQRKNRRSSRRRCSNGVCRRGNNRLLRTLSAKLPKVLNLDDEPEQEKDINLLDLLKTSKSPSQVLMGMDKIRENFCKTQPFAQTIQLPGCHPKTIINNFCYGQCNSFFIPNHSTGPFRTCGNCEANKTHKLKINLVCPGRVQGIQTVHVEKVLSCACVSRPADTPHGA